LSGAGSSSTIAIQGAVLHPGAPGYDQARTVWNAMIDNRPRVIVQPKTVTDVEIAVRWAVDHDLSIGVKCGGHNVVGHGVPDDGLMIDLTGMGAVRASPMVRRAWVEGGALLGALDRATQLFGMATTAGNVSHTGVGGLTLGGGMGWLARQVGLACDNVLSYDVVTADGRLTRANAQQNADLFWALKGGGGNFGVVTAFEFALHKVDGPTLAVEMDYPVQLGAAVLRGWRDLNAEAPRQATFTAEIGGGVVTVGYVWVGARDEGRQLASRLRSTSKPTAERIVEASYLELQTRADAIGGHAKRRYTKNQFISVLSDGAIDAMLEGADSPDFPGAGLQAYGGAIADVPDEATAFSHRNTEFDFTTGAAWLDPSEDEARITAARAYAESMRPFTSGLYANSPGEEDASWVARAFSADKVARLRAIKAAYDPDNRFCHNANIRPAGDSGSAA
jgi:FAD/FMN-containing dehydrogenase